MCDNENYLLYVKMKTLFNDLQELDACYNAEKARIKEDLNTTIKKLAVVRQKYFSELFDQQIEVLKGQGHSKKIIADFYGMKSHVVDQLIEMNLDNVITVIPFVLAIQQNVSPSLLLNITSKAKSYESHLRYPRLIKNSEMMVSDGFYVLLDIRFHNMDGFESLNELQRLIKSQGRYCLTLSEFDCLYLQYPETYGIFHCVGSYYDNQNSAIKVDSSSYGIKIGAVPKKHYHSGVVISYGYKFY